MDMDTEVGYFKKSQHASLDGGRRSDRESARSLDGSEGYPHVPSSLRLLSQLWRPDGTGAVSQSARPLLGGSGNGQAGFRQCARAMGCMLNDDDCELIFKKLQKKAASDRSTPAPLVGAAFGDSLDSLREKHVPWERTWSIKDAAAQRSRLKEQHEHLVKTTTAAVESKQRRFDEARAALEAAASGTTDEKSLAEYRRLSDHAERLLDEANDQARFHDRFGAKQVERSLEEARLMREALEDLDFAGERPLAWTRRRRKCFYCSELGREPHAQRFCQLLLERPEWRVFPREDCGEGNHNQPIYRPVGRAVVDFADDPTHGLTSMKVTGREWFEQKHLLARMFVRAAWMPATYIIARGEWDGEAPSASSDDRCWFMKSAGSNYGRGIEVLSSPKACLAHAEKDETYVVQQHIARPMLIGPKKFHLKVYICPVARALFSGRAEWELWVYRDGFICEAATPWDPKSLTIDSQVTIVRTQAASRWPGFWKVHPKCCAVLAAVVKKLTDKRKLRAQPYRTTFEIFSADFVVDESWKVWLLEFNSGPVLRDRKDSVVQDSNEKEQLDDTPMVRDMLRAVIPQSEEESESFLNGLGSWELISKFPEPDEISEA